MRKFKFIIILALAAIAVQSCKKSQTDFPDPYSGAKQPLGVDLNRAVVPVPASGIVGTTVVFKATGLVPFKDKVKFMFNGEEGTVVSITATEITVKVPNNASTGITSLSIDDQLVLGPQFTVSGYISIDPSFRATLGANGFVSQVYNLVDGRNIVIGGFNNYNNKGLVTPTNRIVRTSSDGELDRTFRPGKAANGGLSKIIELGTKFVIAGGFSGYDQRTENISNITTLNNNGAIDTVGIKVYRKITPKDTSRDTLKFFPRFNGGANDYISAIYKQQGKILATGNFRYYVRRRYGKPTYNFTRDSVIIDSTEIRQIMRLNADGSLDSNFRYNPTTKQGLPGANGPINSIMHTDAPEFEKLVLYGSFTTFDGKAANRLVRLNPNGSIDASFNTGSGANNSIYSLTYNPTLKKYFITGSFTQYNGQPAFGMALLNEDGSFDNTFASAGFDGGSAGFGRQLDDGLIVVSGYFKKYGNVTRNGFMVLNSAGSLEAGYNATGPFSGNLNDVVDTKSADGKRAWLLIGSFNRFDNIEQNNIIRVVIQKP
ncbi:protein of unknown function [Mucilaginibacter pineti]|uniref:DUF5008 domain-containing protein n=1 Tax=Mucilaginibacter pineti TaxID=1391627 RepID=A0A1G7F2B3_9SPHI|nr:DUF5008 domain-containing protein [Mucilaginibacter pineti]SDE70001.1 protein of unknown function [Mucilaginibacter pineti]